MNNILQHQGFLLVPEIIETKLISRYHNGLFSGHFDINKTCKLIPRKFY